MPTPPLPKPYNKTPLIRSSALSLAAGCNIYLKLETLQPSGSFKSRGVGHFISCAISASPDTTPHFYISSGGNAGLACVTAATLYKCPATVVVPLSTSPFMIEKLRVLGADVVVKGAHWREADTHLREELLGKDKNGVYVPPFDHENIWEGHSSLVDELEDQTGGDYDAVVCSVGGGGLFSGIMQGLSRHSRLSPSSSKPVKVLAMETIGADSLNKSLVAGELIKLPAITSIAYSLGATQVAAKAFEWGNHEAVTSQTITDAEAAMSCVFFADNERILVEPACGAAISPAYTSLLRPLLFPTDSANTFSTRSIILVICGGSNVSLPLLSTWSEKYSQDPVVLQNFDQKYTSKTHSESKETNESKIGKECEKEEKVPFVMHNEPQHETA